MILFCHLERSRKVFRFLGYARNDTGGAITLRSARNDTGGTITLRSARNDTGGAITLRSVAVALRAP